MGAWQLVWLSPDCCCPPLENPLWEEQSRRRDSWCMCPRMTSQQKLFSSAGKGLGGKKAPAFTPAAEAPGLAEALEDDDHNRPGQEWVMALLGKRRASGLPVRLFHATGSSPVQSRKPWQPHDRLKRRLQRVWWLGWSLGSFQCRASWLFCELERKAFTAPEETLCSNRISGVICGKDLRGSRAWELIRHCHDYSTLLPTQPQFISLMIWFFLILLVHPFLFSSFSF